MVKGIENLHASGFYNLHLSVVVHKNNYKDLKRIADFLLVFKPLIITFDALVLSGNARKNTGRLAVRLNEAAGYLKEALSLLIKLKKRFCVSSFPLCLFECKFWPYFRIHRYACSAVNLGLKREEEYIVRPDGLSLSSKCIDCQLKKYCPGTWENYYEVLGDDELNPQLLDAKKYLYLNIKSLIKKRSPEALGPNLIDTGKYR